jgi:hypothetical protein
MPGHSRWVRSRRWAPQCQESGGSWIRSILLPLGFVRLCGTQLPRLAWLKAWADRNLIPADLARCRCCGSEQTRWAVFPGVRSDPEQTVAHTLEHFLEELPLELIGTLPR